MTIELSKPSEELVKHTRQFFFAVEHTTDTSVKDIEDMCALLNEIVPRYNMKWCQAVWKDEDTKRLPKTGDASLGNR